MPLACYQEFTETGEFAIPCFTSRLCVQIGQRQICKFTLLMLMHFRLIVGSNTNSMWPHKKETVQPQQAVEKCIRIVLGSVYVWICTDIQRSPKQFSVTPRCSCSWLRPAWCGQRHCKTGWETTWGSTWSSSWYTLQEETTGALWLHQLIISYMEGILQDWA